MSICLTKGCGKEQYSRGLCASCYAVALRMIKAKKVTWELLVDRGMATAPKRGSSGKSLFAAAVEDALAQDAADSSAAGEIDPPTPAVEPAHADHPHGVPHRSAMGDNPYMSPEPDQQASPGETPPAAPPWVKQ